MAERGKAVVIPRGFQSRRLYGVMAERANPPWEEARGTRGEAACAPADPHPQDKGRDARAGPPGGVSATTTNQTAQRNTRATGATRGPATAKTAAQARAARPRTHQRLVSKAESEGVPAHYRGACLTWALTDERTAAAVPMLGAPPGPGPAPPRELGADAAASRPPPKACWKLLGRGGYGRVYHVREVKADGKQYAVKVAHRDNSGAADALRREYVYLHKVVGQFCGGHRSVARTIGWLHRATDYNELESDEAEEGANAADGGDGADDAAPASVAEVEEEPDTQAGHQRNAGTPAAANGAAAATGDAAPAAEGAAAAGAGGSSAPPSLAWDYGVVLQHVAGGTLRDEAIAAALGPFELLKCTSDVLQGLSFLHETCGLIHRDVKARNVVLERAPEIEPPGAGGGAEAAVPSRLRDIPIQAKLIDFGLACMYREPKDPAGSTKRDFGGMRAGRELRSRSEDRWCRKKVGTLRYRPPEMERKTKEFLRHGALPSSDVFSFGVMVRLLVKIWLRARGIDPKEWMTSPSAAARDRIDGREFAVTSMLYELARDCTKQRQDARPTVRDADRVVQRAFHAACSSPNEAPWAASRPAAEAHGLQPRDAPLLAAVEHPAMPTIAVEATEEAKASPAATVAPPTERGDLTAEPIAQPVTRRAMMAAGASAGAAAPKPRPSTAPAVPLRRSKRVRKRDSPAGNEDAPPPRRRCSSRRRAACV